MRIFRSNKLLLLPAGIILYAVVNLMSRRNVHAWETTDSASYQSARLNRITKTTITDLQNMEKVVEGINVNECPRWFKMAITLKKCLSNKISTSPYLWESIADIGKECGVDYLKNLLHTKYLINHDDVKAVVAPQSETAEPISLTLGIGNDLSAELRLQSAFPGVKFYGADPILEDGIVFERIGKYLQVGVSNSGGIINGSALINGTYEWHEITTVKMPNLIQMFGLKTIDYMFLDIEGAEYDLLPELILKKHLEHIPICQINVEVHGPVEKYGVTQLNFDKILRTLTSIKSPYIPLWIPKRTMHQRFLLIDWQNHYCLQQFFNYWC